ncbi:MAG: hypothetical protein RBS99_07890, partial [Rhodospirillales bacterium]|nr:hypothetical protein [Rhodospirillales bacterium]
LPPNSWCVDHTAKFQRVVWAFSNAQCARFKNGPLPASGHQKTPNALTLWALFWLRGLATNCPEVLHQMKKGQISAIPAGHDRRPAVALGPKKCAASGRASNPAIGDAS